MSDKFAATRMNNSENSSPQRLIAGAYKGCGKHTPQDDSQHSPSYLRVFDNFFGLLISESYWEAPRLLASRCGRFHPAQANMAFL
jgi:hypothetical protein